MLEAAVGAVWSGARGWLTPPVLFVLINLVIGTIAVMSRLMSSSAGDGGDHRRLTRAPSVAFDRLRCFSFSRLGLPADHAPQYPAFDDAGAAEAAAAPDGGEWRRTSLLRAPSVALDRIRGFSFSRRGPVADHAPPSSDGTVDAEPSSPRPLPPAPAETGMEREQAGIERSQSEAAARRRPRALRTRMARTEERAGGGHEPPAAVEVDARADDFIRQFREQLRLQRLHSILRYRDTLRRTGTV